MAAPLKIFFRSWLWFVFSPRKLLGFLGTLQLSFDIAVLRAVVCLQPKPAVGPQLPLGAESVGCLHSAIN